MITTPAFPVTAATLQSNWLTYDDDAFLRIRKILGAVTVCQATIRLAEPLGRSALEELHSRFADGPLNRAVARRAIPGARDHWIVNPRVLPLVIHPRRLAPGEVVEWLVAQSRLPVDPVHGPSWALAAADLSDGGSVITWLAPHEVTDGELLCSAGVAALSGIATGALPDPGAVEPTRREEWADARAEALAIRDGFRAAREQRRRQRVTAPPATSKQKPAPVRRRPDDGEPFTPALIVASSPAAQWHDVAAAHGGTANSLFAAVTVELLLACGGATPGTPVRAGMPISVREGPHDLRSNATGGITVDVETMVRDGVGQVTDLIHIRARAGEEFRAYAAGERRDPLDALKPLVRHIPDGIMKLAVSHASVPAAVASKVGTLNPRLSAPFGRPAAGIAIFGMGHGLTKGRLRRIRAGVDAAWSEAGGTCTFTATGLDPDAFSDATAVCGALASVYARWGLTPTFW